MTGIPHMGWRIIARAIICASRNSCENGFPQFPSQYPRHGPLSRMTHVSFVDAAARIGCLEFLSIPGRRDSAKDRSAERARDLARGFICEPHQFSSPGPAYRQLRPPIISQSDSHHLTTSPGFLAATVVADAAAMRSSTTATLAGFGHPFRKLIPLVRDE